MTKSDTVEEKIDTVKMLEDIDEILNDKLCECNKEGRTVYLKFDDESYHCGDCGGLILIDESKGNKEKDYIVNESLHL